jgi:hypothetical protein
LFLQHCQRAPLSTSILQRLQRFAYAGLHSYSFLIFHFSLFYVDYAALTHPTNTANTQAKKTAGHLSVTRRFFARLIVRF